MHENSFAFLLACSLDRGAKSEIIWTIPYWLQQSLGHLDPKRMASMSLDDMDAAVWQLPKKPRYVDMAPKTILELSKLVANKFDGDSELIWKGKSAKEVQETLLEVRGVGQGLATMTVLLLNRCRGVNFPDWQLVNVKPDVHIRRVLHRLDLADSISESAALKTSIRLNPQYPGALDPGLWKIGRNWCRETDPQCANCVAIEHCRYTTA